ncbi:unnamed protein product [Dicrocoelium dendriticum]|nr:unnamed protein product [Dicrocoelium dendriticum]
MTCLLLVSTFFLIIDYLSYKTAWHTRQLLDHKTTFPSITLCAHNPFSLEANSLWHRGEVPSPREIKARYAHLALRMLQQGNWTQAVNFAFSDTIEMYYTNLDAQMTYKVGHDHEMIPYCMVYYESSLVVAEKCDLESETSLRRTRFSHPKYFNCWTIERQPRQTTDDVIRLILLVRLVPSKEIVEANSSFIMDTFTRGEGIKVIVHEPGTYPEIEKHGLNIQPNRMNEITYTTLQWNRLATPVAPCTNQQTQIVDLGMNYTYEHTPCLNIVLQEELIKKCGCVHTEWPRPVGDQQIVKQIPYCTTLDRNGSDIHVAIRATERLHCIGTVLDRIREIKEEAERSGRCIHRCNYFTYHTELSVTKWDPSPSKLSSYAYNYRRVDQFMQNPENGTTFSALIDHLNETVHEAEHGEFNIVKDRELQFGTYEGFGDGTFSYISLIRQGFETEVKEERLILDIYILLSRIGGLCSLCIGLTMAFFIEIIEFAYFLCIALKRKLKKLRRKPKTHSAECKISNKIARKNREAEHVEYYLPTRENHQVSPSTTSIIQPSCGPIKQYYDSNDYLQIESNRPIIS